MVLVKPGRKRKNQHEKNKTGNNKEKTFLAHFLHLSPKYLYLEKHERSELKSDVIFINFSIGSISVQESAQVSFK